jgi:maltose-binding protein MalE
MLFPLLLALLTAALLLAACNRNSAPAGEPAVATVAPAAPDASAANAEEAAPAAADQAASAPASAEETSAEEAPAEATAEPAEEPTAEAAAPPTATPDVTSGNVVLWHSFSGGDADALGEILARLEGEYPGLRVDTLFVAYDDLPQAYTDAVLAGGGPDLVAAPTWWLNEMIDADVVRPLNELLDPGAAETYWPAALANLTRDGQIYGLPLSYELVSLFVNRSLVGEEELPATTDAMLALAQSAPEKGAGLYANLYHLYWGLPAYGAALMDETGVVVLDQGEGAAGFLGWLGEMNDAPGTFVDVDYGMLIDRFKKGEFAFFVDGPWAIDELRGALGDDLGVTLLPAGPAGPAQPWLSAEGVMLNPTLDDAQRQRALTIAQGLTDADAGSLWASAARRLPAAQGADMGTDPIVLGFQQQAATAQAIPTRPEMDAVWGYAGDMIVKTLNGVMTPEEAVVEAAALINEENGK